MLTFFRDVWVVILLVVYLDISRLERTIEMDLALITNSYTGQINGTSIIISALRGFVTS